MTTRTKVTGYVIAAVNVCWAFAAKASGHTAEAVLSLVGAGIVLFVVAVFGRTNPRPVHTVPARSTRGPACKSW